MSLRDELGMASPTPYTLLCPPGWRRVDPRELPVFRSIRVRHAGAGAAQGDAPG